MISRLGQFLSAQRSLKCWFAAFSVFCFNFSSLHKTDAPDPRKVPPDDLIGITAVLLTCHYHGQEWMRIGYYVQCDYDDPALNEDPPITPVYERLRRTVILEPRVTRFNIAWHQQTAQLLPPVANAPPGLAAPPPQVPATAQQQPPPAGASVLPGPEDSAAGLRRPGRICLVSVSTELFSIEMGGPELHDQTKVT